MAMRHYHDTEQVRSHRMWMEILREPDMQARGVVGSITRAKSVKGGFGLSTECPGSKTACARRTAIGRAKWAGRRAAHTRARAESHKA
jgi:Mg-chelatase subunit ChlI